MELGLYTCTSKMSAVPSFLNTSLCLQLRVDTSDKAGATSNFRKVLLNRCQKEFEKDKDDNEIIERKRKDLESASEV